MNNTKDETFKDYIMYKINQQREAEEVKEYFKERAAREKQEYQKNKGGM